MTVVRHGFLGALSLGHRERLVATARDVSFPGGTRIFEAGGVADRFWIIRSGLVALDIHVPGRSAAVVETLGDGDLLGWSWLFEPYRWHGLRDGGPRHTLLGSGHPRRTFTPGAARSFVEASVLPARSS
ncbi:cyclic nucleotide-binding domain-containing protein [Streptomyces sp. NPDC005151]